MAWRALLAFLLGLQASLLVFITLLPWIAWIPAGVLLAALFLSLFLDPRVRQGMITRGQMTMALLKVLLVIVAPMLLVVLLSLFHPSFAAIAVLAAPLEVSLVATFAVGSGSRGLAITCGVCTWVGLGIPLSIATYQQSSSPDFPGLVCGIILVGVAIGFGIAAGGGLLGRLVHRWALGW